MLEVCEHIMTARFDISIYIRILLDETCDQFECRGGEYCLDEGKRICVEKTKYCIHKSLQCDGIPNCGERDNSDEENCKRLSDLVELYDLTELCVEATPGK